MALWSHSAPTRNLLNEANINQTMVVRRLAVDYHGQSKDAVKDAHRVNREALIAAGLFNPDNSQEEIWLLV